MTSAELIHIFEDTQRIIRSNAVLQQQLLKSQCDSQLFLEGYTSPLRRVRKNASVDVTENTTFQCAREVHRRSLRTAVLNFANPYEPGGGVLRGAMAQEECLCRCSDLYNVLAQPYFLKHYYQYHQQKHDLMFSDRLIYSPDISVFKSDDSIPQVLKKPFCVDVITCAAPYLNGSHAKTDAELMTVYRSRIRNILEAALSRGVDCIILGAFGCGAFRNNPTLMAQAFADLLLHEQYAAYFQRVIFAIRKTARSCPNLLAFEKAFSK